MPTPGSETARVSSRATTWRPSPATGPSSSRPPDAARCCGSAGIYNLTHPEIASQLQGQKVEAIRAARPDIVVSANPGCILQVRAGLREAGSDVPVVHLMRFLDDPEACLA